MNRIWVAAALFAVIGGFATAAQANPIPIYDTGVASSGTGHAPTGAADPHWVIASSPGSSAPSTAYVVSAQPATWATTTPGSASQWIAPAANGNTNVAPGQYSYQTTFDLTGLNPATASLTGSVAVDNCLLDILINGHSTGIQSTGATSAPGNSTTCINTANFGSFLLPFTISTPGDFVGGVNTLTFVLFNAGTSNNPSGINIQISGTAAKSVPEPATLGLFGLGLLGLGGLWLRRRATT